METDEKDLLDELVEERTRVSTEYPRVLAAAERSRVLVSTMAQARARAGMTQAQVARRMGTSQPAVARLERGEADPRLSTVERYAECIGWHVEALPTP